MRLILLGPPGCGKGTQAALLCRRNRLEHIGTGDLLRQAIREHTVCGERARPFVEAGRLVPDDLVNDLIAERFQREDRPDRFVMDGYPRTLAQAASFDLVLRQQFLDLSAVVLLTVSDAEIVRRLSGRWSCPQQGCKATYHTVSNPPRVERLCDNCGTVLVQRDDDQEDTVRRRLVVYHKNTEELIPHYRAQGLLREAPGEGLIEEVYQGVMKALKAQAGRS
jgi:adenylate kinase